jgi:hypothetical protein
LIRGDIGLIEDDGKKELSNKGVGFTKRIRVLEATYRNKKERYQGRIGLAIYSPHPPLARPSNPLLV